MLDVILLAAMPISELRGAIPLALYKGYSPIEAFVFSVVGNLLPVPFLLLFLHRIRSLALRWGITSRTFLWFEERTLGKRDIIDRYGYLGLVLFVAIPLPVTGAWTAALLATLLDLKIGKSFAFIAAGVVIAGLFVTFAATGINIFVKY
ncbi:MAG: ligand-binding protein SH3 [Archaeoglobales archaeon]|nr:MAG: ligand-binding protein SH3 [Archaeoglobales archaeon]